MKGLFVGFAVLLGVASLHGQKTRAGQEMPYAKRGVAYPVTVHVYGIHLRYDCGSGFCTNILYPDVVANGRKLELQCGSGIPEKPYQSAARLTFGDFRARVLKGGSGVDLGDEYELLLPNNKVMQCVVAGMME